MNLEDGPSTLIPCVTIEKWPLPRHSNKPPKQEEISLSGQRDRKILQKIPERTKMVPTVTLEVIQTRSPASMIIVFPGGSAFSRK